ncbi:MAG: hypothetical protein M3019_08865 [Candidatus Dormibacteraeota bacterium]|nr:hypothetical protein [Candidatus Dormibacteraeota bacterium]
MKQSSPAARDRAQRRVRSITIASAAGAGVLTVAGIAVTAGTFAGRTVAQAAPATQVAPSDSQPLPTQDPSGGLQQPVQQPTVGTPVDPNASNGGAPIVSGGS